MTTIIFTSIYLNRRLYWLFGIGALVTVVIFLKLNISEIDVFQIMTGTLGGISIFIIYSNRCEPQYLTLEDTQFKINFINKFLFSIKEKTLLKSQIKIIKSNEKIVIFQNSKKVLNIRKASLKDSDWDLLSNYFT